MRYMLPKNWHPYKCGTIARLLLCSATILLAWLVMLEGNALSFTYDDIMQSFNTDFGRVELVNVKPRYISIVSEIIGMKIETDVPFVYKNRGDLKQDSFNYDMKSKNMGDASAFSAYEYLLKQFHIIKPDADLKTLLIDSMYNDLYGFYDPDTKKMVFVERTNNQLAAAVLLHELAHAAQDNTIGLSSYRERYCKNLDSCLAASALIEGQASVVDLLFRIERNLKDKSSKEILKSVYDQMQASGNQSAGKKDEIDCLVKVRLFPYTEGTKFVMARYLEDASFTSMFERVPVSSEQVLHPEKFRADEKPMVTKLSEKKPELSRISDASILLESTLGEYHIQAILGQSIRDNPEKLKTAAAGWGGDSILVFRNGNGFFFAWDTLWDTPADADEFYQCYLDAYKIRNHIQELKSDARSVFSRSEDGSTLMVDKDNRRVFIVEGQLSAEQLESLRHISR